MDHAETLILPLFLPHCIIAVDFFVYLEKAIVVVVLSANSNLALLCANPKYKLLIDGEADIFDIQIGVHLIGGDN